MKAYPALLICLSGICSVTVRAQSPGDIPTVAPQEQVSSFGTIGVASGQTIRLNAANPGAQEPGLAACKVRLQLVDDTGQLLKEMAIENLAAGRAASLDLARPAAAPGIATPQRIQMRGVVRNSIPAGPLPLGPEIPVRLGCTVIPTVEIFDNDTGKTTIVLSSAQTVAVSETAVSPLAASIRP